MALLGLELELPVWQLYLLPPYSSTKSNKLIQSNKKNSSVKGCHKKGHKKKRKRKLREYKKLVDERSTRSQLSTMDINIAQNKIATIPEQLNASAKR